MVFYAKPTPETMRELRGLAKSLAEAPATLTKVVTFAVNDTVEDLHLRATMEMDRVFDKPTPYMKRGLKKIKSGQAFTTQQDMKRFGGGFGQRRTIAESGIYFEEFGGGTSPADVIRPHIYGGSRVLKRFEKRLRSVGTNSARASVLAGGGRFMVPTKNMPLDQYGNPSGARISQMLFELNTFDSARRNPEKKQRVRRNTRSYFLFFGNNASRPIGIAERIGENRIRLMMVFTPTANYQKRYDLFGFSRRQIEVSFPKHFTRLLQRYGAGLLRG